MKRLFIVAPIMLFLVFIVTYAYCEEDQAEINNYMLKVKIEKERKERDLPNEIKKLLTSYPMWSAYLAFKNNNTKFCAKSSNENACWDNVQKIRLIKALAEGNCGNIPQSEVPQYGNICLAIKNSQCDSLKGWQNTFCQAFLNEDRSLLNTALSSVDFPEYVKNNSEKTEFFMNIYLGFKNHSEAACSKFSAQMPLSYRLSCNMLFGNQSAVSKLDALSNDIATAVLAKEKEQPDLCDNISSPGVNELCLNTDVKTQKQIIKKIWN